MKMSDINSSSQKTLVKEVRDRFNNITGLFNNLVYEAESDVLPSSESVLANYTPLPEDGETGFIGLQPYHDSEARIKGLIAGIQSGKSTATSVEFIVQLLKKRLILKEQGINRPILGWVVSPTYKLTNRCDSLLRQIFTKNRLKKHYWASKRTYVLYENIYIQVITAKNPDTLVSDPVDVIWVNEAARMLRRAYTEGIEGRITATNGVILWETSSKGRSNWVYELLIRLAEIGVPGYYYQSYKTEQNVFAEYDKTLYGSFKEFLIDKRKTIPPEVYKREYEASLDVYEGQIYKEFNLHKHAIGPNQIPSESERLKVIYGLDPGFINCAMIVILLDKKGNLFAVDEFKQPDLTTGQIIDKILAFYKKWGIGEIYCDNADRKLKEDLKEAGIIIRDSDRNVKSGILTVQTLLYNNMIYATSNCIKLLDEFTSYHWREGKEEPEKVNDHLLDALRYVCMCDIIKNVLNAVILSIKVKRQKEEELSHELVMHIAAMDPRDAEELLKQPYIKDEDISVQDLITQYIAKLGENIKVGEFIRFEI